MSDWRSARVAPDETHHVIDGRPLYSERFERVQSFHAPGLAPVQLDTSGWHIDVHGRPIYRHRYRRVFGFYDRRAAVVATAGWHHISPTGEPAYDMRYAWCGNYQECLCAVRDRESRYRHIDRAGAPAYSATWRYAGDFRHGIAVVQGDDGLSRHIDCHGDLLHDQRYLDLDVFHKGWARARDAAGWTHIDRRGRPLSKRRFAMVEPFYNGQARVERFDGGLEVIDECGHTIIELRPPLRHADER